MRDSRQARCYDSVEIAADGYRVVRAVVAVVLLRVSVLAEDAAGAAGDEHRADGGPDGKCCGLLWAT